MEMHYRFTGYVAKAPILQLLQAAASANKIIINESPSAPIFWHFISAGTSVKAGSAILIGLGEGLGLSCHRTSARCDRDERL